MVNWTRRRFLESLSAAATVAPMAAQQVARTGRPPIKITDLRCAIIGRNPTVRIVTDQGVSGYGQAESAIQILPLRAGKVCIRQCNTMGSVPDPIH